MAAMSELSVKQKMLLDVRRMSLVYPAALLTGVVLMALQSLSGIQIFTFDRPLSSIQIPDPGQAVRPPPTDKRPPTEEIERINMIVSQTQQSIEGLSKQLEESKNRIAALSGENGALNARVQQLERVQASLDGSAKRIASLESRLAQVSVQQLMSDLRAKQLAQGKPLGLPSTTEKGSMSSLAASVFPHEMQSPDSMARRSPNRVMVGMAPMYPAKQVRSNSVSVRGVPSWATTVGVPYVASNLNFSDAPLFEAGTAIQ